MYVPPAYGMCTCGGVGHCRSACSRNCSRARPSARKHSRYRMWNSHQTGNGNPYPSAQYARFPTVVERFCSRCTILGIWCGSCTSFKVNVSIPDIMLESGLYQNTLKYSSSCPTTTGCYHPSVVSLATRYCHSMGLRSFGTMVSRRTMRWAD